MRTLMFVLAAIGGIFGGSVWAVGDSPLPKAESISFIKTVEAKCPDQMMSPKFNYQSPCLARVVMEFTDFN